MGVSGAAAWIGAAVAAGGTTYGIISSKNAREDAADAAKKQAEKQDANASLEKAQTQQAQVQQQVGIAASQNKLDEENKRGYQSTINTTPSGLTGVAVTGGQKTLLGG